MGISFNARISSSINETDCIHWKIPEGVTQPDAAAIPLAYITVRKAFY